MAQVANKPLHLDGTPGHGQGLGSGSGAGIWLAGTASSPEKKNENDKENRAPAGRSYHIPTNASRPTSRANDLILTINPSDSGDVDLDLSFDFVSQLETAKIRVETPTNNANEETAEPSSPRGMSTARWSSRLKKQPPSALKLPNKKQLAVTASHFSPISPLDHKAGGEAPLLVIPLSSTRRAKDSGIGSEQIENLSPAEVVQMQRLAAQSQIKRSSPEKRSPAKQSAAGLIRKRTILGENRNKGNAQIVPSVEVGDVFDDGNYDYTKHLITSDSQVSAWTGNKSTSYGTALESTRKHRQVPDSMESMNTYGSALTAASTDVEVPVIEVDHASNGLGLDLNNAPESNQEASAPLNDTADSSPDTPFSPNFSESDTTKSHSDGVNTPSTAFSTLFDDRMSASGESKSGDSAQMKRGLSAPLAGTATVGDTIKEEESSKASSHADLHATEDGTEHLTERHEAIASVSDFGSSPIKGDRPMIVSTASSPSNEVDFLFRKPAVEGKGGKAIPWPQSPLLLNFAETTATDNLSNGLGLGIDMGGKMADHMQVDMSELSVERVILPMLDANTLGLDMGMEIMKDSTSAPTKTEPVSLAPMAANAQIPASPSFVSSVEGFAINMTPIDVVEQTEGPASATAATEAEGQGRSRWSSKLWSLSPLTSLRSPNRAKAGLSHGPTMRTLTLVNKSKAADSLQVQEGYNSVPSSAVLPTFATFTPLQPPSQALASRARSSRHVSRSSRLQYKPNEDDHIQVDMTTPPVDRGSRSAQIDAASQFKSSEAPLTPKMEYVNNARTRRHSWGYASTSGKATTASWTAPKFLNVADGFGGLRNSTLSAVGAAESEAYRPMDTVVEDGIRRRANHRATNSVPSTPSVIPMTWTSPRLHEPYPVYNEDALGVQFDHADEVYIRPQQGRRRTGAIASTIGVHGPSSTLGAYLLGLTGTRSRNTMVKTVGQQYATRQDTHIPVFSDDGEQIEGIIAFSGRALENASPSKSLFFAGFLGMPWLWFIGGWGLENDGSVYVNREGVWEHSSGHRASNYSIEPTATHVSGLNPLFEKRASMLSARAEQNHHRYSMGTPESVVNMEEEYHDFQRRGKARSFTGTSTPLQGDDQLLGARKAHSLLEGEERNSMRPVSRQDLLDMARGMHSIDMQRNQQEGFAFSSQLEKDNFSHHDHGAAVHNAFAMPASAWDDYDDLQQSKGKKRSGKDTFLQQVRVANVSFFNQLRGANGFLVQRFTSSASTNSSFSLANIEQRRKAEERARVYCTPDHQPVLIRVFTDFTRLETFVLWNRLMAIVVSIAVFGAAGVALYFVVTDW